MVKKKYFWNSSMRLPFSIKWIHLIERRNFDQKYKLRNKNDMASAWRNFQKKSCGISTYDNWNFKPQTSSVFQFDRASDGRMAHELGVNAQRCRWHSISNAQTDLFFSLFYNKSVLYSSINFCQEKGPGCKGLGKEAF